MTGVQLCCWERRRPALLSVILVVGGSAFNSAAGNSFDVPLTPSALGDFLPDYFLAAAMAFLTFLITAILAVLAAMYSRSILGGTLTGIVLIFVDPLLMLVPRWLASFFEAPAFLHLVRAFPFYNIENFKSWTTQGVGTGLLDRVFAKYGVPGPTDGVTFSVVVLSAWVVLGLAAILVLFERQDITT